MRIFKNKKGVDDGGFTILGMTPKFLIGLVMAAIIIVVVLIPLITKPAKMLISDNSDQTNKATHVRLANEIGDLIQDNGEFVFRRNIPIGVTDWYYIIGFNKGMRYTNEVCPPNDAVPKPEVCEDYACICLYNGGLDNENYDDEDLIDCELIPGADFLVSSNYLEDKDIPKNVKKNLLGEKYSIALDYPENLPDKDKLSRFVMYGECDGWWNDIELGTNNYYIEKYEKNDVVYVYIGYESEKIDERIGAFT